jgi:predicted enzyme related to lactoylglutathione lyase
MERVTGIGGLFFRAKDPATLTDWYRTHLGVDLGHEPPWRQEAGITVMAAFDADTDYFGRDSQQWMINFRVESLDAMTAQLEAAGIAVQKDPGWDMPGVGRFARIQDPEGNPIELWEPDPGIR